MNDDDWLLRGLSGAHTHGAFEAQAEPEMLWLNLPFDSLSGIQSPALPASPMSPLTGLGPAVLSPSKFASSMQPSAKLTLPETVQPSLSVRPGDLLSPVSELSVSVPDYAQKSKRQRNVCHVPFFLTSFLCLFHIDGSISQISAKEKTTRVGADGSTGGCSNSDQ